MEKLERFDVGVRFPRPSLGPASRHPPLPAHATLPTLNQLHFQGNSEHFDDFDLTFILLYYLGDISVTFFNQLGFFFAMPQLLQLIICARKLITINYVEVLFHSDHLKAKISSSPSRGTANRESLVLVIRYNVSIYLRVNIRISFGR
jgi:hypothetical protein